MSEIVDKLSQVELTLLGQADDYSVPLSDLDDMRLGELMRDDWLRHKLDWQRRVKEHVAYIRKYVPWIADARPGLVVDIGPGGGELLCICRELGHDVQGIDAQYGAGGMGDAYLEASRLLCSHRRLAVEYVGALEFIRHYVAAPPVWAVLINSRGSLEQVFWQYMEGQPHHLHHKASQLSWRLSDHLTGKAMRSLFRWAAWHLRPGGMFLAHLNGSSNSEAAERLLDATANAEGLTVERPDERVHLWRKPEEESAEDGGDEDGAAGAGREGLGVGPEGEGDTEARI